MKRTLGVVMMVGLVVTTTVMAAPTFKSAWKNPEARETSFVGKTVAALVITQDESLRVAGEEALARELTGRGFEGSQPIASCPVKRPLFPSGPRRGSSGRVWKVSGATTATAGGLCMFRPR